MTIPPQVKDWLQANGQGAVTSVRPVGGGCINNAARLQTSSGRSYFLKTNPAAPGRMFACEARGLQALSGAQGPRLPQPIIWGDDFLLMEDLKPAPPRTDYWPDFGRRLACLHNRVGEQFGFEHDNFIGSTPQPNTWMLDGFAFFAEKRLLFQARLAQRGGLLPAGGLQSIERLAARLPELAPAQSASLLHGDLWGGNAISDADGAPAIIDPAAHYGWAEAELAMTALFGSFPDAFYSAYGEVRPLLPGWRGRFPLYNLYHLLNHLNLFGAGYQADVLDTVRYYTGN